MAKPKLKNITITMPEVVGVPGGMGAGGGGMGGLGFNFDMDLFGGSRGTGNEFIGTFYDLKQTPDGEPTDIGERAAKSPFDRASQMEACKLIKGFVGSGFNEGRLKDYFKAPKLKYATTIMMPPMAANAAPKAFGVEDQVKPSYWICHYKGQIAAPESGEYRFCGLGDDILIVRVGRRVVLDACWPALIGTITSWDSDDDSNRQFPLNSSSYGGIQGNLSFAQLYEHIDDQGGYDGDVIWDDAFRSYPGIDAGNHNYMSAASRMVIGDWVPLRKGQIVDVDILIGEIPGGEFMCRLLIEKKEGANYKTVVSDAGVRKVLPVFKTTAVDDKLVAQMKLEPQEMTMDGPVFGAKTNGKK